MSSNSLLKVEIGFQASLHGSLYHRYQSERPMVSMGLSTDGRSTQPQIAETGPLA